MLSTLDPCEQEKALRRALRTHSRQIFYCNDCHYPWIGRASNPPLRCANRKCRAGARSPKRKVMGRPPGKNKA